MPSAILATAGYDHTIRFWESLAGTCYRTIHYNDSQVNRLEISPDRQYIVATGNPHIRFYEIMSNNPNPVNSFDGHKNNVTAIGYNQDGRWLYTGSEDQTIKIWDIRAPGSARNFDCQSPVNSVVLHPNQTELISADQNGSVRVWDLSMNACSRELVPDGETAVRSVSIAPDGTHVAAANNAGRCFVWRLADNDTSRFDPLHKVEAHSTFITKCLFSPDAKFLATSSADHTVKLWSTKDYALVKTLAGHQRWVWDMVFSANGAFLVTGSSDQVGRLWDLKQGETIRTYTGHSKAITTVALGETEK